MEYNDQASKTMSTLAKKLLLHSSVNIEPLRLIVDLSALLLLLFLAVALVATVAPEEATTKTDELPLSYVERDCSSSLDQLSSLADIRRFLEALRLIGEDALSSGKHLKACRKSRAALLALSDILDDRSVCHLHKVDRLINYHSKFLTRQSDRLMDHLHLSSNANKQHNELARRLFERYAVKVAFSCKQNLRKNLAVAQEELQSLGKVFREARERVYSDEPELRANIRMLEEQPDTRIGEPQDNAEIALAEYRDALTRIRRPEDVLTFERADCLGSRSRYTLVAAQKLQTFFRPSLTCQRLQRYYAGSVLSIARLANAGYVARDELLDKEMDEIPLLRDWVLTVQVCEPLLHMSSRSSSSDAETNKKNEDKGDAKSGSQEHVLVDTCAPRVEAIEPLDYQDRLEEDELDDERLAEMLTRSEASRPNAQKIMKSALRRIARLDIERQLRDGPRKGRSLLATGLAIFKHNNNKVAQHHNLGQLSEGLVADLQRPTAQGTCPKFKVIMSSEIVQPESSDNNVLPEKETFEALKELIGGDPSRLQSPKAAKLEADQDDMGTNGELIDSPVGYGDPLTMIASTLVVMAIMFTFEWVFFCVMTLAAKLSHDMNFKFENLLTFPPKFLSWSDADFATLTEKLDRIDEDDFFDYEELTADEQRQRQLLSKVFGRPPPMAYRL